MKIEKIDVETVINLHDILHIVYKVDLHDDSLIKARKVIAKLKFIEEEGKGNGKE